jgi:hypothetical protein
MAIAKATVIGSSLIILITTGILGLEGANGQQPASQPKPSVTSLTAQGFEIRAAGGTSIPIVYLQKGKDVFFCELITDNSPIVKSECYKVD